MVRVRGRRGVVLVMLDEEEEDAVVGGKVRVMEECWR